MNINVTLFGEMITFSIFIWFTLKYVWPPITGVLAERQATIADSLEKASKAKLELVAATTQAENIINEANTAAKNKLTAAKYEGNQIISEAKTAATKQAEAIYNQAKAECDLLVTKAKVELKDDMASFATLAAQKILEQQVDEKIDLNIVNAVIKELTE
jgi:F-type H+-transporting ATPase subunit b